MRDKLHKNKFVRDSIEINRFVGSALQDDIAALNKAVLNLLTTAARMGNAEPLAAEILGIPKETLLEFATIGRSDILLAQAHGFPLAELRIKDAKTLKTIIQSGFGGRDAMAEILKSMPIELITGKLSK